MKPAEALAGVGGLALLISLFLPWYADSDAWQALTVIDLLIAFAAALAIAVPIVAATNRKTDAPITVEAVTALAGVFSVALVLFRVLDPAAAGAREAGLYLALASSLVVLVAAWRSINDDGT